MYEGMLHFKPIESLFSDLSGLRQGEVAQMTLAPSNVYPFL